MKTRSNSHLLALFATSLGLAALPVRSIASDTAATLLRREGIVRIANVGPHVVVGTFRIQVAVKLGPPDTKLEDGTWLYHHRQIAGSEGRGTLVVRFSNGRVHSLALATPTVVAALRAHPQANGKELRDFAALLPSP